MKINAQSLNRACYGHYFKLKTDLCKNYLDVDTQEALFFGIKDEFGQMLYVIVAAVMDDKFMPLKDPLIVHTNAVANCRGSMIPEKMIPDKIKKTVAILKEEYPVTACKMRVRATSRLDLVRDLRYNDVLHISGDDGEEILFLPFTIDDFNILYGFVLEKDSLKTFKRVAPLVVKIYGEFENPQFKIVDPKWLLY